jgi:hypothetical protein
MSFAELTGFAAGIFPVSTENPLLVGSSTQAYPDEQKITRHQAMR